MSSVRRLLVRRGQILAAWAGLVAATSQAPAGPTNRVAVPFDFSYEASAAGEAFGITPSTPWIWLPPVSEGRAFFSVGNIPYAFALRANALFEYDAGDVWPGNLVPMRIWIEPAEDSDRPELYGIFGFEVGVAVRPVVVHRPVLNFGKDFCVRYAADGPAPLGPSLLGGIDAIECVGLPLSEVLGSSTRAIVRAIAGTADALNRAQFGFCAINVCAEGVLEGEHIEVLAAGHRLRFRGYGQQYGTNVLVHIPLERENPYSDVEPLMVSAAYCYNFYQSMGLVLSLIPPIELWITPSIFDRWSNLLPGSYAPPALPRLHDGTYYMKSVAGAVQPAGRPQEITLPIAETPNLPDLVVAAVALNPSSPDPAESGRAYAAETSTVRVTIANLGVRATEPSAILRWRMDLDGSNLVPWTALGPPGAAPILAPNSTMSLYVPCRFSEGRHNIAISLTYLQVKQYTNGAPVYGMGDPRPENHFNVQFPVYVHAERGTVRGIVDTNPSWPGSGIPGLLVWLHGPRYSAWTTSSLAPGEHRGTFRFPRVPTDDYTLEILMPTNGAPDGRDYANRAFVFHHDVGGVTELRGTWLAQYQTAIGRLRDASTGLPIINATVEYGVPSFRTTNTDATGSFRLRRVPPRGPVECRFSHPLYEPRRIAFDLRVDNTWQTNTVVRQYMDLDTAETGWADEWGTLYLVRDISPPVLDWVPPPRDGAVVTSLVVHLRPSDGPYRDVARWRWLIANVNSQIVASAGWMPWTTPSNREDFVATAFNVSNLADGRYTLQLYAEDPAGLQTNVAISFVRDSVAPSGTLEIAEGAISVGEPTVPITIRLAQPEPLWWTVELSNDGVTWSPPFTLSGTAATLPAWPLAPSGYVGQVTVTARVTDASGHIVGMSDSIAVDASGLVQLAGGAPFYGGTNVPVDVFIRPPPPWTLYDEPAYGQSLEIGREPSGAARAQRFVLTTAATVGAVRVAVSCAGYPDAPLELRLVGSLGDSPTGAPPTLAVGTLTPPALPADGVCTVAFPSAVILSPGTYYLITRTGAVSTQSFWRVGSGYSEYGNHQLRYDFLPGSGWRAGDTNPAIGCATLAFRLLDDRRGQIRFAADSVCDTEPWTTYTGPAVVLTNLPVAGAGRQTVAVQYRNPFTTGLDRVYYDSVVVDLVAPTVQTASIVRVNTEDGVVSIRLLATDDVAGVRQALWSFDGGAHWQATNWLPELHLPFVSPFSGVLLRVVDEAGLTSQVAVVETRRDLFPPEFNFSINNADAYTRSPTVTLRFAVWDDRPLRACRIRVREQTSGRDYGPWAGTVTSVPIALPPTSIESGTGTVATTLDGRYQFEATATDGEGRSSPLRLASITLDRQPPTASLWLCDEGGRNWTTGAVIHARLEVADANPDLRMRQRLNGGPWSLSAPLPAGLSSWVLVADSVPPRHHELEMEISDAAGNCVTARAALRVNHRPLTPTALWPRGEIGDTSPKLFASDFSDPDGEPVGAAEYLVREGRIEVLASGPTTPGTFAVARGLLQEGHVYTWVVRYMDADGLWSEWSEPTVFEVAADSDHDGLSDHVEKTTGTHPLNPDTDGDGIPDGTEDRNLNGAVDPSESDPRSADTDNDALPDGIEDRNRNGERDPGETDPANPDTDQDGLRDGEEDTNANGRFEPALGETHPNLADTDGDSQSDGDERYAGTDPNDRSACFALTQLTVVPDGLTAHLRWKGRGHRRYWIEAARRPGASWKPLQSVVPEGGNPPWYFLDDISFTVPLEISARFFRIRIEPPETVPPDPR
ncbi:MAG: carboxypeptidase regulatory-like domain-containing protein [Kiritimatiellae bacterium]|nr:carboxypeptidase regulatory-like domain-containing protein [Kiritimatiellia bacterium]